MRFDPHDAFDPDRCPEKPADPEHDRRGDPELPPFPGSRRRPPHPDGPFPYGAQPRGGFPGDGMTPSPPDRPFPQGRRPEGGFPGHPLPPLPLEDMTTDGQLLNLLRMTGHLALSRPGLRSGQFRLLSLLEAGEPVQQRVLAERLRIQPGSLSELLGKLEQAGAVVRQRSSEDRRSCTVQITAEGLARLRHMRQTMDIDRSELLCVLSDGEKEQLLTLLRKVVENARPQRPERPDIPRRPDAPVLDPEGPEGRA